MLQFSMSNDAAILHGVKFCVHGRAGAGKTTLVSTMPNTILVNAESGILSLRKFKIPLITISTIAEMDEAYEYLTQSSDMKQFDSISLDSISEIAEKCLNHEKKQTNDGRRAYGEMNDKMLELIKKFRDIPNKHVYFSAKQGSVKDEITNLTRYGPLMPGKMLGENMPYLFDEVFSLEVGETEDKQEYRYLRTKTDIQFEAKDRSGALDRFEQPHLGQVIEKILAA